jgi:hypothetical protein
VLVLKSNLLSPRFWLLIHERFKFKDHALKWVHNGFNDEGLCIMPYTIYTHAELLINLIIYFDLKVPGGPQKWPWPAWNFGAIHSVT